MSQKDIVSNIIENLGYEPKIYTRKDGRKFARVKSNNRWLQLVGTDEDAIYQKLFCFYSCDQNITDENILKK